MVRNAVVDCETSIIDKGHPFNPNAKLVLTGILICDENWNPQHYHFCYEPKAVAVMLEDCTNLLFHNAKFDMHHLRRHTSFDPARFRIFDTQYAEFLISNQREVMPSLNACALKYLNNQKIDIVKEEYWEKGIDTENIPKEILEDYLKVDLDLTLGVFKQQMPLLKEQGKWPLFLLGMADLKVLEEMEYNGLLYDKENSIRKGHDLDEQLKSIRMAIESHTEIPDFNPNSDDHISLLLYGGIYEYVVRLPIGVYKSGTRIGEPRYQNLKQTMECPRLVEPLPKTEVKKEGFYQTNEQVLKSLKTRSKKVKTLIDNILEYSKLEKLKGTYYLGIPQLIDEKQWNDNIIHGQLNQCVAVTGRLSSSKPNQQNFDPRAKQLCISRYDS